MIKLINKIFRFTPPSLVALSLIEAVVEVVKYQGFIQAHFHHSPIILFSLTIVVSLCHWNEDQYKLLLYQSRLFPGIVFLYLGLSILESVNYPNYVFSKYHINIQSVYLLLKMELIIYIMPKISKFFKKSIMIIARDLKLNIDLTYFVIVGIIVASYYFVIIHK